MVVANVTADNTPTRVLLDLHSFTCLLSGSAVNEQFRSLLIPRGVLFRRVLNITMLLWLLEVEIIKRVPFQLPEGPWKTSMKMKYSSKITIQDSQQWRWNMVLRVNCRRTNYVLADLLTPHLSSSTLPESQPNPLPYTSRTSEQTEANLTAKIQIKTLAIDISDQQIRPPPPHVNQV